MHKQPSPVRQDGGLNALKNNPTQGQCENPRRPFLKATDNAKKTVYYIRPPCKLWSCKPCAEQRRRLWVFYANYGGDVLLAEGRELVFVTLTSHEANRSLASGVAVWRKAWKTLSARWRRKAPGAQYFYVGEHKRTLHFHVHMVTSANIKTRWYKDNARQCGLGYQAKAVPIIDAMECGAYMGKYLGKAIAIAGWPRGWRRVNTTRDWPRPPDAETPYTWKYLGNQFSRVAVSAIGYRRAGWTVETSIEGI